MNQRDFNSEFMAFRRLAREGFNFLFEDYHFAEAEAEMISPGMWVTYRNRTTQLSVYFEYSSGVNIKLGPLKESEGRFVPGPQYTFHDFLTVRAPDWKGSHAPYDFDEQCMRDYLRDQAAALRAYADDVLQGDFRILESVEQARAERIRRMHRPATQ